LADAAETGLFDTISHPDLIKNETAADWLPSRLMPDICRTLDRIAATGVAMELNTSGINKRVPEMNPFPEMLAEMCSRDIPVVIGADAHEPDRVGDGFIEALSLLEQAGYRSVRYYIDRQPHSVAIDEARASLL
jgi:histidinol-phosphatase (PHP family)